MNHEKSSIFLTKENRGKMNPKKDFFFFAIILFYSFPILLSSLLLHSLKMLYGFFHEKQLLRPPSALSQGALLRRTILERRVSKSRKMVKMVAFW